jgi:hypothetical protein
MEDEMKGRFQSGITLVVSMIMLIVLTLLVVSAIRFGSINLKIAGNAQMDAEAATATQVAMDQMLIDISDSTKIDTVPAKPQQVISTGGTTYKVDVAKPSCGMSRNVVSTSLDPSNAADRLCFGGGGGDPLVDASGKLTLPPTECKDQLWDVKAILNDAGSPTTIGQGVAARVSVEVQCP